MRKYYPNNYWLPLVQEKCTFKVNQLIRRKFNVKSNDPIIYKVMSVSCRWIDKESNDINHLMTESSYVLWDYKLNIYYCKDIEAVHENFELANDVMQNEAFNKDLKDLLK